MKKGDKKTKASLRESLLKENETWEDSSSAVVVVQIGNDQYEVYCNPSRLGNKRSCRDLQIALGGARREHREKALLVKVGGKGKCNEIVGSSLCERCECYKTGQFFDLMTL